MSDKVSLQPELQELYDQVEAIKREAEEMVKGLTEEQCAWQPTPQRWSIAQCIEHLNVTARMYFPMVHESINQARAQGWLGAGPFKYGWLVNWFVRATEPPPKRRFKAPRRFVPPPDRPMSEIWPSFLAFQERFRELIVRANGVDLARARVQSPAFKFLTFPLGRALALTTAHERRHLWQARQVLEELKAQRDAKK